MKELKIRNVKITIDGNEFPSGQPIHPVEPVEVEMHVEGEATPAETRAWLDELYKDQGAAYAKTLAKILAPALGEEDDSDFDDLLAVENRLGRCYELAINETDKVMNVDPVVAKHIDDPSLRIVHGYPRLTRQPYERYGHAWLEWEEDGLTFCYDVVRRRKMFWFLYYALGQIREDNTFRYDRLEARRMCVRHEHYGPWEGEAAGE